MREGKLVNYPDILGAITRGPRKTFDCIQCALTSRPDHIPAGQTFEAILMIQSLVDSEVDVRVELELPQRDVKKQRGMFFSKQARLLVGLQPAEVGYITLPISCSPKTTPAEDYVVGMKIQVKKLNKQVNPIRLPEGGGTFTMATLAEEAQKDIQTLQRLSFSVDDGGKRNMLQDTFGILPPSGIASLRQLQAGWVSLWTMRDYMDDSILIQRVKPELDILLPQLNRTQLFKPFLQTIQEHFKQAAYPLHVAEAIYVTKILTLVVEQTAEQVAVTDPEDLPNWLKSAARVLFQEKRFANQGKYLMTEHLFPVLLHETIMHAFTMVKTVLNEDFGTQAEMTEYAESIVTALTTGQPINFARTYLPLICAGIIANTRVTMPREQVRESLFMISRALEQRRQERTEDNAFVFEITNNLIERGLEHF